MRSDETVFRRNGHINRHNSIHWTTENLNVTWQQTMQAEGLTVWTGIWSEGVIGPHFFDGTVIGQSYLAVLNDYLYPTYSDLSGND